MFRLTIDLPPTPTASEHPSREAARAELLRFFTETGQAYRVTEAAWTHTCYDVVAHADDQALLGRAVIDAVCALQPHPPRARRCRLHGDGLRARPAGGLRMPRLRAGARRPDAVRHRIMREHRPAGADMSARPLSVVPPEPDPRRGKIETPLPQWDCEHQLVGALLHLSATQAAPILQLRPRERHLATPTTDGPTS